MKRPLLALAAAVVLLSAGGCRRRRRPIAVKGDGGPAVVVVEATPPAKVPPLPLSDEKEPDDARAEAQPIPAGQGIRGTLGAPHPGARGRLQGDIDVYSFIAPAVPEPDAGPVALEARIELGGVAGIDLALEVLDGDFHPLLRVDDGHPGEGETVPDLAVEPGHTYYLRVKEAARKRGVAPKGDPAHPYTLVVRFADAPPGASREPDDDGRTASSLAGGTATGYYGWRHDTDWVQVPAGAGPGERVLRIELSPVAGVTPELTVLSTGPLSPASPKVVPTIPVAVARGGKGDELRLRNVSVPASADVSIQVKALDGHAADQRWLMQVAAEGPLEGAEHEPNDDLAHANSLAVGASLSGFLWPGDRDVYRITGAPGKLVTVSVDGVPQAHLKLEQLDAAGRVLAHVAASSPGQAVKLPPLALGADGAAYCRVSARPRESAFDVPYRIVVAE